ncbi:16S rRNA (cytosine(1402)-N(4))-methyltransferase RsmH [Candidatus Saccharibacteria bacterium]|nr:16S rRNA (cytosine(1402)-N(4))-methyltransferase RsmH [Candidatus Saccharibacteria bacterium]
MEELHKPVLLSEVLEVLSPRLGETYLDLTAGYGGHASKVLDLTRNYKGSILIDRDSFAVEFLKGKYLGEPIEIVNDDFYNSVSKIIECGKTFDIVLADFGVSSPQLDRHERGFSFRADGPLDMRMDKTQDLTADRIVNHYPEGKLVDIFVRYGEERPGNARRLAREIVHARPFKTTLELADFIKAKSRYSKIHPATKVFQAIRIEVNDELGLIERTLPLIPKVLKPGGRVAIITFHSLEDRLVKNFFKEASSFGEESELEIINKDPIVAGEIELVNNPRARSAKLRAAKRPLNYK